MHAFPLPQITPAPTSEARLPLGDQVASQLAERIILGEIAPGQRITEMSVEIWSGASRSPIREAFRLLERDGLVGRKAHGGVTVTTLDPKQLDDIYGARVALEGQAAAMAARRATAETVRRLTQSHQEMVAAFSTLDCYKYVHASVAFVETVHEATSSGVLRIVLRLLLTHSLRYRMLAIEHSPGHAVGALATKTELIEAIRIGDAAAAQDIASTLTRDSWERIKPLLGRVRREPGKSFQDKI